MKHDAETQPGEPQAASASTEMIAQIVAAFAQRPDVGVADIVKLTQELTGSLQVTGSEAVAPTSAAVRQQEDVPARPVSSGSRIPVIAIEEAVSEDAVTCLCCGKSFKTLKRHLMSAHGMTETQYRAAYGLSEDFPLVAPSYSRRRSQVASDSGFGTHDRSSGRKMDAI